MKVYQKPEIQAESIPSMPVSGQYIFEFTPGACPGFSDAVGQEGGYAFCIDGSLISGNFTAEVTCANVSGTYTVHVGTFVEGGGLDCGSGESIFAPFDSVTPELPDNCIVNQFLVDNEFDDCDVV
jgi:hypothetical protein